ncbi:Nucleic-acid-binding protein from mobile element jockey [Eumeta japonica]|uniref:Nucleic-acid-binding protein from mobile element jockey n=1 Tax=Eumeta variegata TaxID=151549 RepID=A0A4C1ZDX6_EUMVA|nr:Nucleic-acid-binding protein from mobile element jockey [Eumeta japonica]
MLDGPTVWKQSQTVVLTFHIQMLPQRVFLCYSILSVEVYIYRTIQCYNCCRYGHIKAQCRSQPRCFKCGNAHIGEPCTVKKDKVSCLHCLGRYTATSKLCPELYRQKYQDFYG